MKKTVQDHIEATKKRLAEAAAARQEKLKSGSTQPKIGKLKLPKPQGNVPKIGKKPSGRGR
jgi:hypothetical protein